MGAEASRVSLDGKIKGRKILNILRLEFISILFGLEFFYINGKLRFCKSVCVLSNRDKIQRVYYNAHRS